MIQRGKRQWPTSMVLATYGLGTENKKSTSFVVLCPDVPTTVGASALEFGLLAADVTREPTHPTMRNRKSSILRS